MLTKLSDELISNYIIITTIIFIIIIFIIINQLLDFTWMTIPLEFHIHNRDLYALNSLL